MLNEKISNNFTCLDNNELADVNGAFPWVGVIVVFYACGVVATGIKHGWDSVK